MYFLYIKELMILKLENIMLLLDHLINELFDRNFKYLESVMI
jgi:hypothetical protein